MLQCHASIPWASSLAFSYCVITNYHKALRNPLAVAVFTGKQNTLVWILLLETES